MSVPGPTPAPAPRPPSRTAQPEVPSAEVEHPALAAALQEVAGLDDRPLAEHHERLSRAHEALHAVLHPTDA